METSGRVAFFLRAYNDVDHFVPIIAEFVKNRETPDSRHKPAKYPN